MLWSTVYESVTIVVLVHILAVVVDLRQAFEKRKRSTILSI